MPSVSAGILLFRRPSGPRGHELRASGAARGARPCLEVLLVHPGGPYWARRDDGWWSIPKGEIAPGESPLEAAEREVGEELGQRLAPGPRLALGEVVQAGGKRVHAWAAEGDLDAARVRSATFEIEWPPRSGTRRSFPEVDRAEWFPIARAREKVLAGQLALLDRLEAALADGSGTDQGGPAQ